MDIVVGERLRTGIYESKYPVFDTVVAPKLARLDWEIQYIENETTAYRRIDGHAIGPRFLGHLTEDGRVIGFLMERITMHDMRALRILSLASRHCLSCTFWGSSTATQIDLISRFAIRKPC